MVRPGGNVPSYACKACTITFNVLSQICPHCSSQVLHGRKKVPMFLLSGCTLIGCLCLHHTPPPGHFPLPLVVILQTAKRCAALAFTHSIAKASISASLITLMTQPMVGVPRMMGTLFAKLEKFGMTRAI